MAKKLYSKLLSIFWIEYFHGIFADHGNTRWPRRKNGRKIPPSVPSGNRWHHFFCWFFKWIRQPIVCALFVSRRLRNRKDRHEKSPHSFYYDCDVWFFDCHYYPKMVGGFSRRYILYLLDCDLFASHYEPCFIKPAKE